MRGRSLPRVEGWRRIRTGVVIGAGSAASTPMARSGGHQRGSFRSQELDCPVARTRLRLVGPHLPRLPFVCGRNTSIAAPPAGESSQARTGRPRIGSAVARTASCRSTRRLAACCREGPAALRHRGPSTPVADRQPPERGGPSCRRSKRLLDRRQLRLHLDDEQHSGGRVPSEHVHRPSISVDREGHLDREPPAGPLQSVLGLARPGRHDPHRAGGRCLPRASERRGGGRLRAHR